MRYRKVARPWALVASFAFALASCENAEEQRIVIPPGGQIQYNTARFLYYSDDHYRVFLRKAVDNLELETIFEVTPKAEFILDPEVNHSTIVPKGESVSGTLVLQVDMEYHKRKLYALVFDEEPVQPTIETTLVYQLLANYPAKSIKSYTPAEVRKIQAYIENLAAERMEAFGLDWEMNPDQLYNFLKNSLSTNLEFFAMLEAEAGIEFAYDADGNIITEPYPFGSANLPPVLVEEKTTALGAVAGMESELVTIEAQATDPDGDLLFYAWRRDGEIVLTGLMAYTWLPLFNDGRPEPYDVEVVITDGGKILGAAWELFIQDVNRKPRILGACGTAAYEQKTWSCKLIGEDPDFDTLTWTLSDSNFNSNPTLQALPAGPVSAADGGTAAVINAESGQEIRIEWKPDNADALPKTATLNLKVADPKLGMVLRNITLSITDYNSPPCVRNGDPDSTELCATSDYVIATNAAHNPPHEWDACLEGDPDGVGDYTFDVEVIDPDNRDDADPKADPPDEMDVTISGNVGAALTQPLAPDDVTLYPDKTVFHYIWRPTHTVKTASLFVQMSDTHGGMGTPVTVNLVAEDRNQMACFSGTGSANAMLTEAMHSAQINASANDGDGDIPLFETYGVPWKVSPFLRDCGTPLNAYVNFSKRFGETDFVFRKQTGTQCFTATHNIDYAGIVLFERAAPYAGGPITIPAGFKLRSDFPATSPYRIDYEVHEPVTIEGNVRQVSVPVRAVNRALAANDLTIIQPPVANLTIAGSAVAGDSAMVTTVTFGRSGPGDIAIPDGTILRTDEGAGLQSIRFRVTDNYFFPDGQPNLGPIKVVREEVRLGAGQLKVRVDTPADATLSVSNPEEVSDRNGYRIYGYKAQGTLTGDEYCFGTRLFDGAVAVANEITRFVTPNTFGDSTLGVNNSAGFSFNGQVQFTRTAGNPDVGNVVSIPAGTRVGTPSGKKYQTDALTVLAPGQLTATASVSRVMDPSPNPPKNQCVKFGDINVPVTFRTPSATSIFEGNDILGHEIRVSDNAAEEMLPMDPDDRYVFPAPTVTGLTPNGTYRFCRTPGNAADPNPITDNCTPCNVTAGLSLHQTRKCYFRFRPTSLDIANTFQFQVKVDDQGASVPTGSQVRYQNLQVTVQEQNDPQIFTQSDFTTSVAGQSVSADWPTWIAGGTPHQDWGFEFSEGSENTYFFYIYDPDKSLDYKTINLSLDAQIYDVASGALVAKPAGLSIALQSFQPLAGGIGANTTGRLRWNPTDEEAKRLSSAEGFIVRVNTYDAPAAPNVDCTTVNPKANCRNKAYGYFLLKVKNRNNAPEIDTITTDNSFAVLADSYFSTMIKVRDPDAFAPFSGWNVVSPHLTMCQDANGAAIAHATLDPAPVQPVMDCHGIVPHWPLEAITYDPGYADNSAVPACRSGAGLNEDLAVPKLTLVNAATKVGSWMEADYRLEWCPQKGQLGSHLATLYVNDNGDEARSGEVTGQLVGSTPLRITVQAPVFFISPREDLNGDPEHFMVQTAAGLSSRVFRYKTIVRNSKGNPLSYELLASPRPCGELNGMCIGATGETQHLDDPPRTADDVPGVITWMPRNPDDITDPLDPLTWHQVKIRVTDTVTGEKDEVAFQLQVDNPFSPFEKTPAISARVPVGDTVTVDELDTAGFQVTASDPNPSDVLHYRWYVDGVLIADEGASFDYTPDMSAGSADADGPAGPLLPGQHVVTAEVTDGNYDVSTSWTVTVRNVYLVPEALFDVVNARKAVDGTTVASPQWLSETMLHTSYLGKNNDYLLFTGNWTIAPFVKHYVWSAKFVDGTLSTPVRNYYEHLPWQGANVSRRIAAKKSSESDFNILVTPQASRMGPFDSTTNSVKVRGDLTAIPSLMTATYSCTGTCAYGHYAGDVGYGSRPSASHTGNGAHAFYADDSGKRLIWDRNMASATEFFSGTDPIFDVAVNSVTKHLFATTQNVITRTYKIYVFDIAPVESSLPPTALTPAGIVLSDGVPGHEDLNPTDVITDSVNHRAFVYLAGTGGIAVVQDGVGKAVFGPGDVTFVGIDQLSSSPTDTVRSGRRLAYDPTRNVIMGISRLGRQIFTIDGATMNVKALATDRTFETILNVPESNLTILVDRDGSAVYKVK